MSHQHEPSQQTGFRYLAPYVASQLELAKNVPDVEGRQPSIDLVFLSNVLLEFGEVRRLTVIGAQFRFPLHNAFTIQHLLLAVLQVVAILLRFRLLATRVMSIAELGLLLGSPINYPQLDTSRSTCRG